MKTFNQINEMSGENIHYGLKFYVKLMESDYDITDWKPGNRAGRYEYEIEYPDGKREWMNDMRAAGVLNDAIR